MSLSVCIYCGRRFQSASALAVRVESIVEIGGVVCLNVNWAPGCPTCYQEGEDSADLRQEVAA